MDLAHIDTWIFDLDNTLYSGDAAFFSQIDRKMTAFVSRYLDLPPLEARKVQKQYLEQYGTTLSGLMAVHGMEPGSFLDDVHDIDLTMLPRDPQLRPALQALPGRKFIFTNGSQNHAKNVGDYLGIMDQFDGVFAIEDADYLPKPKASAYDKFIDKFAINPQKSLMAEDMVRNLEVPKQMGMHTLLITSQADWSHEPKFARPHSGEDAPDYVDHHTGDLSGWLFTASQSA